MNFVSITTMHRAGSGLLSYLIASSDQIMTLPDTTSATFHSLNTSTFFDKKTQKANIKGFLKKNEIIFDPNLDPTKSKKLGWTNLGDNKKEFFEISQDRFTNFFIEQLDKYEPSFPNFLIALHQAYYSAMGKSVNERKTIVLGTHSLDNSINFYDKLIPNHRTILCVRDPLASFFSRLEMERKINISGVNYDTFHSLMVYSMQCQFIRRLTDNGMIIIRLEDLHADLSKELAIICQQLNLSFTSKMTTPTINGYKWNGEYWSSGLKTGKTDPQLIQERNRAVIEKNNADADLIKNFLGIDCYDLYPHLYKKPSIYRKIMAFFYLDVGGVEFQLLFNDLRCSKTNISKIRIIFLNFLKFVGIRAFFIQGLFGLFLHRSLKMGIFIVRYGDLVTCLRRVVRKLYEI